MKPILYFPHCGLGNRCGVLFSFLARNDSSSRLLWVAENTNNLRIDCNIKFNDMFEDIDGVLPVYDEININETMDKFKNEFECIKTHNCITDSKGRIEGAKKIKFNTNISNFIKSFDFSEINNFNAIGIRITDSEMRAYQLAKLNDKKVIENCLNNSYISQVQFFKKYEEAFINLVNKDFKNNLVFSNNHVFLNYLTLKYNILTVDKYLQRNYIISRSDAKSMIDSFKELIIMSKCKKVIQLLGCGNKPSTFYGLVNYLKQIQCNS